jgi:hypothetical protein
LRGPGGGAASQKKLDEAAAMYRKAIQIDSQQPTISSQPRQHPLGRRVLVICWGMLKTNTPFRAPRARTEVAIG